MPVGEGRRDGTERDDRDRAATAAFVVGGRLPDLHCRELDARPLAKRCGRSRDRTRRRLDSCDLPALEVELAVSPVGAERVRTLMLI